MPQDSINASLNSDRARLVVGQEDSHHPLPVVPALFFKMILMIVMMTASFTIPVLYTELSRGLSTFSILQFLHIFIWTIIMILTCFTRSHHNRSHILGYHNFYNSTNHLYSITLYVFTLGNALLLVLSSLTRDYCLGKSVSSCSLSLPLSAVNYYQLIICLEVMVSLPFIVKYIIVVAKFNSSRVPPDVLIEAVSYSIDHNQADQFIGFQGPTCMDRVLERQADMLQSLQHRNNILCQQVYLLAEQIQTHQNT